MTQLRIFDSFQKRKVDFQPLVSGEIGMYLCGPTVYDSPHIGHARSAVAFDAVRRYLCWRGYRVKYVRNITDIDDKIIKRANERGESPSAIAHRYSEEYRAEMASLGVLLPDVEPTVTDNIDAIINLVSRLIDAGKSYCTADGDVYFSVESFPAYGMLSGQSIVDLQAGARVEPGEHKRSPLDFALWKAAKPGEPAWDSPWGAGRPGWHIECSAMTMRYLGETFDIHAGGKDLIFPHHENEIAQSQGVTGSGTFARYWLHNGFVNLNDVKMSKSLGNVFLIMDVRQICDAEALRLYILQYHYRSPISFEVVERNGKPSFPGLEEAERRLDYFYTTLARLEDSGVAIGAALPRPEQASQGPVVPEAERFLAAFVAAMDDDFNTAAAIAELGEAVKAANKLLDEPRAVPKDVRRRSLARLAYDIRSAGRDALGLLGCEPRQFLAHRRQKLAAARGICMATVDEKLGERDAARKQRDYARADQIRAELHDRGVEVMDTPRGSEWRVVDEVSS
ncbi:MAG: cysteine--tRNA ligase [Pseudomonadota bacterium]